MAIAIQEEEGACDAPHSSVFCLALSISTVFLEPEGDESPSWRSGTACSRNIVIRQGLGVVFKGL